MGDQEQPTGGTHFVGKKDELIKAKRTLRTLEGRDILIIYNQEAFYAMDAYCYREYSFSRFEFHSKSDNTLHDNNM